LYGALIRMEHMYGACMLYVIGCHLLLPGVPGVSDHHRLHWRPRVCIKHCC
jgi:hypothetical protein